MPPQLAVHQAAIAQAIQELERQKRHMNPLERHLVDQMIGQLQTQQRMLSAQSKQRRSRSSLVPEEPSTRSRLRPNARVPTPSSPAP